MGPNHWHVTDIVEKVLPNTKFDYGCVWFLYEDQTINVLLGDPCGEIIIRIQTLTLSPIIPLNTSQVVLVPKRVIL